MKLGDKKYEQENNATSRGASHPSRGFFIVIYATATQSKSHQ